MDSLVKQNINEGARGTGWLSWPCEVFGDVHNYEIGTDHPLRWSTINDPRILCSILHMFNVQTDWYVCNTRLIICADLALLQTKTLDVNVAYKGHRRSTLC